MYDFIDYIKILFFILTVNHAKSFDAYKYHMCKFLIYSVKKIISILFNHFKYATTYIKRLHVFIAKVLVTTGYPLENGYHSEVIDLLNPNSTCDSLPDFPVQIHSGIINNIQKISGLGNMNFSYSTRKQI